MLFDYDFLLLVNTFKVKLLFDYYTNTIVWLLFDN